MEERTTAPGWYRGLSNGEWRHIGEGYRYFDGEEWTDEMIPPMHLDRGTARQPLAFLDVVAAVALGGLLCWAAVWIGAQASPEHIFWPVKFVVDQAHLYGK